MAGDRANDAVRITGKDIKAKVIGEGANLGMTQRGRIEAAFTGVRLNTDAIDNSAGVNTSDVEVNIKIALSTPVRAGKLTIEARNKLLADMTDEVARLVLRNNYLQSLALSLSQRRGLEDLGFQQRLMQVLEQRDLLNRGVEFLPDDMTLAERRKRNAPLTRPELAVLLAYAKLTLFSDLIDSKVPDDPYLSRELGRYFPRDMSERFPEALTTHRLRREIIATQLSNSLINRGGPALVVRIADQTGASAESIAFAFTAVRDSYGMPALNDEINALDNKVPGALQLSLYADVENLLLDRIVWFLRNVDFAQGLKAIVTHYRDGIAQVATALDGAMSKESAADCRGPRSRAEQSRCPRWPRQAHGAASDARPRARYRADRDGRQEHGRRRRQDLFRRRGVLPARQHRRCREGHRGRRLFRSPRARPRARHDRRRRAPHHHCDDRQRCCRRSGGGEMGRRTRSGR